MLSIQRFYLLLNSNYVRPEIPGLELFPDLDLGLRDRKIIKNGKFIELTAYCFPDAINTPLFSPFCHYITWLFLFDDYLDREIYPIDRMIEQIQSGVPKDKYGSLLLKILLDLPSQEFKQSVIEYLQGVSPSGFKDETFDQYVERRLYDSAVYTFFPLAKMIDSQSYCDLKTMRGINEIISLGNDVFSYEKELLTDESSGVKILISQGLTLSQSVDFIFEIVLKIFDELRNTTLDHLVKNILDGITIWTFESNRYKSSTSPFTELRY